MEDILKHSISSAREAMEKGALSSVELTKAYLTQIRGMNGTLNAYLSVFETSALEEAKRSDERRAKGETLGPLDGMPMALKDNLLVQNERTTAGSKILENYVATNDATVVRKLKEGGAVILGKTNMDEFAFGSSTEHSAFGPTHHPRDFDRVPGGTSGGSACAVAADLCVAALGSDTGGSIRQPAALCGVVGFKPTYGRVSRSGLIANTSSFDQIGPMTKTVRDAALLFEAIQGQDSLDQTTVPTASFQPSFSGDARGLKIGIPKEAWGEGMSPGVRSSVQAGVDRLRELGANVQEVSLPYVDVALAVYYVLLFCEASTNLSRFDGIRYGKRVVTPSLIDTYAKSRVQGFGSEVKRRILLGTYALSKGYYDAYYRQARKAQTLIRRAYADVFKEVDVLVTPTAPNTAWKIGEKVNDPLAMYLEDIFTVGANVAAIPAISVPCGDYEGLPVGMQLLGPRFADDRLIDIAYAFEQARI